MPRRAIGPGVQEKALERRPQRFCPCGAPVVNGRKKWCWDCEARLANRRKKDRVAGMGTLVTCPKCEKLFLPSEFEGEWCHWCVKRSKLEAWMRWRAQNEERDLRKEPK